jgi:outer membrane receptor protein involved in Fe transport
MIATALAASCFPARILAEEESAAATAPDENTTVVTATRMPRPVRDAPAAVTVLPRSEIERSPTQTLDELLRTIPSFATFRRSNSVASDPTAQGLNLRGIGPSGVSRSLVLVDGEPANDPFGGWFYWRSIPRLGIERVEIAPGGGSALYGNYALGGVVQVISRPISGPALDADAALGLPRELWVAARGAQRLGALGASLEGEAFSTAGYPVVAPYARGSVDGDSPSDHQTLNGRVELQLAPWVELFGNGGYFRESQNGGTEFTTAQVSAGHYRVGARFTGVLAGDLELGFFGHAQSFNQKRARISTDRSMEALAASQNVPSDDQGLVLAWTSAAFAAGGTHRLAAGAELRRIHGSSHENLYPAVPAPTALAQRASSGEQRFAGAFLQDSYEPIAALELIGALRFDAWQNLHASQTTVDQSGAVSSSPFEDRSDRQLSPKLGARYRPVSWLALRGSAYTAFRAPTLNELYRPFQVGTILTAANASLGPETLRGGEGGIELTGSLGWTLRATGFWSQLRDPITNVTLPLPLPDGSQRQRENAGQARIRGVELDGGWRISPAWTASAAYTFVDSSFTQSPGNPQLIGKQLAQDPSHRATVSLSFEDVRWLTATLQTRFVGPQFEDDQNLLAMPGFLIVDLFASRRLFGGLDFYAAAENLFNHQYLVGRAGVDTVGQPFTIHVGVRLHAGR